MQTERREMTESRISALTERFAARGVLKSVWDSTARQIDKEEETRAMAPEAYRLSLLSEAAVRGQYRGGKDQMDTGDLVRYFRETRRMRIKDLDFSEETAVDMAEEEVSTAVVTAKKPSKKERAVATVKELPKTLAKLVKEWKQDAPAWFDPSAADTSYETRRFPLSAFAALAAVAVSLLLIVASSIMITTGENNLSRLTKEVNALSSEVAELKSDLDVKHDLQEIRRIAVEEYGMVDQQYLRMQYISLGTEDSVEAFEEEREESVGLSAILSAIGFN